MPENYRMCFFRITILVGIYSIFLGVDSIPMPDMAAFLVFPTGSETGGYVVAKIEVSTDNMIINDRNVFIKWMEMRF